MGKVHREKLPYRVGGVVLTPYGPRPIPAEAIDAASGQCLDLTVNEAAGVVYLYEEGVAFQPDTTPNIRPHTWRYEDIQSFAVTSGGFWLRLLKVLKGIELRTLTLNLGSRRVRFRVGTMFAANAAYVLSECGVPSR